MPEESIKIFKINNPFDRSVRQELLIPTRNLPPCASEHSCGPGRATVKALVDEHCQGLAVSVGMNGQVVPADQRESTIVRAGDCLTFIPTIQGGGDSGEGKQVFSALAMIAVTAGSAWAGGAMFPASAFWSKIMAGIVALTGGLIVNSLMPTPGGPAAGKLPSQAYSWAPVTTQQSGLPIPHYYGLNRVTGNIISAFTSVGLDPSKQTLNMVVALGRGPIKSITNIKINNRRVEDYSL